ncbi:hypothetical protein ACF0H5_007134 [Mactra antiquata]
MLICKALNILDMHITINTTVSVYHACIIASTYSPGQAYPLDSSSDSSTSSPPTTTTVAENNNDSLRDLLLCKMMHLQATLCMVKMF